MKLDHIILLFIGILLTIALSKPTYSTNESLKGQYQVSQKLILQSQQQQLDILGWQIGKPQ